MNAAEREQLKENLRGMIGGRFDGIDIDTPFCWTIEGVQQPEPFFKGLSLLLPADAVLYFEGCSVASEVAAFYESHRARNAVAVTRDTIFPTPDIYHVSFSSEVLTRLLELAARHSRQQLFNHIKAYQGESLLFAFHDAFEGCLVISEHIPERVVAEFCRNLGVTSRREQTQKRDRDVRWLLQALENPQKVSIRAAGERWWGRLWRHALGK